MKYIFAFFMFFSLLSYSQKFERQFSEAQFNEAMKEFYGLTDAELKKSYESFPNITDEAINKFVRTVSYETIYEAGRRGGDPTFFDKAEEYLGLKAKFTYGWKSERMPYAEKDHNAILFSIFWFKYQYKFVYEIPELQMTAYYQGNYKPFVGQKLDYNRIGLLREIKTYIPDDMGSIILNTNSYFCIPDINYIYYRNGQKETIVDFLEYCETNSTFSSDELKNIKQIKSEFIEDYGAKRLENLISGKKEDEIIAIEKKEADNVVLIKNAYQKRQVRLENEYADYLKDENSAEYYYYKAKIIFMSHRSVLGSTYANTGTEKELTLKTIEFSDKAIKLAPNNFEYRYYKALSLLGLDKHNEAYKEMDLIITRTDTASVFHYYKSRYYYDNKDYENAVIQAKLAKKYKTKMYYEDRYKRSIEKHYPDLMEISDIKVKEIFKMDFPAKLYDDFKISSISQNRINLIAYHDPLDDDNDFCDYVIYSTNGELIKKPSDSWEFFENGVGGLRFDTGIVVKLENDVIPARINLSDYNRNGENVYLNKDGEVVKSMKTYNALDYLSSFHHGFSVYRDNNKKESIIYDKNFKKVAHDFIRPYPISNNLFIDKLKFISLDINPLALKSLDGSVNYEYIFETLYDLNENYIMYRLLSDKEYKHGLIDKRNGKIIQKPKYLDISDLGDLDTYFYAYDDEFYYFLNRESAAVEKKYERYELKTGDWSVRVLGNNLFLFENAFISNLEGEVIVKENFFSSIGNFNNFGITEVRYHEGHGVGLNNEGLIDSKFRKIELPKGVDEIVEVYNDFILVRYSDGKHGVLKIY
jgi:hypothetical protein